MATRSQRPKPTSQAICHLNPWLAIIEIAVNILLLYGSTNFMSIEPNYVQVGGMGQSNGTTAPPTANGQANSAPLSEVINQAFTKRY